MFLVNANASSVICSFTIALKITLTQLFEFEWSFLKLFNFKAKEVVRYCLIQLHVVLSKNF